MYNDIINYVIPFFIDRDIHILLRPLLADWKTTFTGQCYGCFRINNVESINCRLKISKHSCQKQQQYRNINSTTTITINYTKK